MTFHVGQKVVCVVDAFGPREDVEVRLGFDFPRKGQTYTVREIRADLTYQGTLIGLLLHEISNPPLAYFGGVEYKEVSFDQGGFRPLVETKTDISIFTEILDRENAKPRDKVTA